MRTKPCEPDGKVRMAGGEAPEKLVAVPLDEPEDEEPLDELDEPPDEPDELEEPLELLDEELPDGEPLDDELPDEELLDEGLLEEAEVEPPDELEPPWFPEPPQAASNNADAAAAAAKSAFNRIACSPMDDSCRSLCRNCSGFADPAVRRRSQTVSAGAPRWKTGSGARNAGRSAQAAWPKPGCPAR